MRSSGDPHRIRLEVKPTEIEILTAYRSIREKEHGYNAYSFPSNDIVLLYPKTVALRPSILYRDLSLFLRRTIPQRLSNFTVNRYFGMIIRNSRKLLQEIQ